MTNPHEFAFSAGATGPWTIDRIVAVRGAPFAAAPRFAMTPPGETAPPSPVWRFRGVTSHTHYATRAEVSTLAAVQQGLGRPEARCGVMIPIKKSAAWWAMAQDERRQSFEEISRHTAIGLDYLPAVARKLFHSRQIGEPFDFITWFEFAPEHSAAFQELCARLRATCEWRYVEHEVEVWLNR